MTYCEYPKALYRKSEYIAVSSLDQEAEKRAEGFTGWQEDFDAMMAPLKPTEPVAEPDLVIAPIPVPKPDNTLRANSGRK